MDYILIGAHFSVVQGDDYIYKQFKQCLCAQRHACRLQEGRTVTELHHEQTLILSSSPDLRSLLPFSPAWRYHRDCLLLLCSGNHLFLSCPAIGYQHLSSESQYFKGSTDTTDTNISTTQGNVEGVASVHILNTQLLTYSCFGPLRSAVQ